MTTNLNPNEADLHDRAYSAMERGELREASRCFDQLLQREPDDESYHYMRGLAHKYLRDWPTSLHHNQRAIDLADDGNIAAVWNAGIAATVLGQWREARRLWALAGIQVPEGEGSIDGDFGVASIRLNAWDHGETLFARRIDVVRARLLNVPLPESGYRFDDIVLYDGAATGGRFDGEREVSVFNSSRASRPQSSRPSWCSSAATVKSISGRYLTQPRQASASARTGRRALHIIASDAAMARCIGMIRILMGNGRPIVISASRRRAGSRWRSC